jgi:hypothetical protein
MLLNSDIPSNVNMILILAVNSAVPNHVDSLWPQQ